MKKLNFIEQKEFETEWVSKVPSNMIADEEFIRPQYKPQHPLELETKKFIKDKEEIQKGSIIMGLCEEDLRSIELFPHETTYHNCFNFYSISVVKMNRDVFDTLKSGLKRYIEFSEQELHDGINYQGEVRQYSKDYISSMNEKGEIIFNKGKVPMNSKKIQNALKFMSKMAILVIEREFELRFKEVHTDFYNELNKEHPDLTLNETKICAFLRLNMSTKEISAITHQSVKSINMARFRLRKKLNVDRDENLISYLNSL